MAFIIDTYNKYDSWDREHSRYTFEINGVWYGVKEVELEWGQPVLPQRIDREQFRQYQVYDTLEEAYKFVSVVRRANP